MSAKKGEKMKITITSDTHFGDLNSQLATLDASGQPQLGNKYPTFRDAIGKNNDYLVLLGDIIDVAVEDYKVAFDIFRFFLNQIYQDGIAKKILYIPGNHDYDIWHTIEYQTNIINPIIHRPSKPTSLFRMSVPAVLDDRASPKYAFFLGGVTRRPDSEEPYGHLFLDFLSDEKLRFSIGFPNAYVATRQNETILLTHGQYFQVFWSLVSEWAPRLFQSDLKVNIPLIMKNLVQLNFPVSQLSSSGVGQAGPLTDVTRQIQFDFKNNKPDRLKKYLDSLQNEICDNVLRTNWYNPFDWLKKGAISLIKKSILKGIQETPHASPREDETWEYRPETLQKMSSYYLSSCEEIKSLNAEYGMNIPNRPSMIIFGHSHRPIALQSQKHPILQPFPGDPFQLPVYNTGGWLERQIGGKKIFSGIELFIYETDQPLKSVTIS